MIVLKSKDEIEKMRVANEIVGRSLKKIVAAVEAGITTADLDAIAEEMILAEGARPSFKGYRGFPASLCTSINEEVVHGIPGKRKLKEGDIVKLDLGSEVEGYYGDSAVSVAVGAVSKEAELIMRVTREALYKGIEQMVPGNRLTDIGAAIQEHAEKFGFSVVRDFVGHGIGRAPHEDPQVPNYGPAGSGPVLKAGMVLAIEPMVNVGSFNVEVLDDGWTVVTEDSLLSAHFEHSIAITESGPDILSEVL